MSDIRVIEVPKWGLSMEEGTLNAWLIEEGESFAAHQALCEIETSKIANVLEAPFAGVLRRRVAEPGQTIPVGGVLGVAADASVSEADIDAFLAGRTGSTAPSASAAASEAVVSVPGSVPGSAPVTAPVTAPVAAAAGAAAKPAVVARGGWQIPAGLQGSTELGAVFATPHAVRLAQHLNIDLGRVAGSGREGRIAVRDLEAAILAQGGRIETPATADTSRGPQPSRADDSQVPATSVARRLAASLGINLHDCRSTGSRGRVCKEDVLAAQGGVSGVAPVVEAVPESVFESLPMSGMRKAIATRLQASKRNAPHFRLNIDLDLENLLAVRAEINRTVPAVKLSVNDLLIKACALALVKVPDVNVQFDEASQTVRRFADADIAVAVALPGGLITPIIRAANRQSLAQISSQMLSLVTRAKAGTLKPEEFQGGTFSISNLGMLGVRQFDAIVNPPQAAILAIGAGEQRVVALAGQPAVRMQMSVSLACDHRVIDGALGATFLKELKRLVESPALMLV